MADNNDLNSLIYDIRRISEHRIELTDERIQAIYEQLEKDLDAFLADGYKKYADADGRLYLNYLDSYRKRAYFLQEIVDNVDNLTPKLKEEFENLIDETYETCYTGMIESLKNASTSEEIAELVQDIDVDPNTLKQALNNNISKLTLPAVLEAHRAEIIYQIQRELTLGLINGDRYEKMSKRISERCNVSKSKANNITRTESHRNVEGGFHDCAENINSKLDGSGLVYVKTYRTMKDERVRPNVRRKTKHGWKTYKSKNGADHQNMEGVTIPVNKMFTYSDGCKTMFPGSLELPARHACNCRCFLEYNLLTEEEYEKIKKNGGKM